MKRSHLSGINFFSSRCINVQCLPKVWEKLSEGIIFSCWLLFFKFLDFAFVHIPVEPVSPEILSCLVYDDAA